MCRVTNHQARLPRVTSSLALNASSDGVLFWDVQGLCSGFALVRRGRMLTLQRDGLLHLSAAPLSHCRAKLPRTTIRKTKQQQLTVPMVFL